MTIAALLAACGSMRLEHLEMSALKKEWVISTDEKSLVSFEKSLVFLGKFVNDSNTAIKVQDKQLGRIIAKIRVDCVGLKRPDVINNVEATPVFYNVDLAFKDNKTKLELEMTGFSRDFGQLGVQDYFIAKADGQSEAVSRCLESLKNQFETALRAKSSNW